MNIASFVVSVALLGVAVPCVAQQADPQSSQVPAPAVQDRGHHHGPERETQRLTRELSLTPDQAAQVEPILASQHEQMHALHTSGITDPATLAEQRRSIAKGTHDKLIAVLTPEQREQWKAMRAEHHHHRMDPQAGQGAPAPGI